MTVRSPVEMMTRAIALIKDAVRRFSYRRSKSLPTESSRSDLAPNDKPRR
ncbi:hypothetical protein [Paenibacillus sp. PL2-23]